MRWNAAGWFGGQIGATLWILVAGVLTAIRDISTGMIAVLLFAIPNAIGLMLWHRRRLTCYASTQLLIASAGICSLLTVHLLQRAGAWRQIQSGGSVSATSTYWIFGVVFVGLMIIFYLRFGRSNNRPEA